MLWAVQISAALCLHGLKAAQQGLSKSPCLLDLVQTPAPRSAFAIGTDCDSRALRFCRIVCVIAPPTLRVVSAGCLARPVAT